MVTALYLGRNCPRIWKPISTVLAQRERDSTAFDVPSMKIVTSLSGYDDDCFTF